MFDLSKIASNFDVVSLVKSAILPMVKNQALKESIENGLGFISKTNPQADFNSCKNILQNNGFTKNQFEQVAGAVESYKLPFWAKGFATVLGGQKRVADMIRSFGQGNSNTRENAPELISMKPTAQRKFSRL